MTYEEKPVSDRTCPACQGTGAKLLYEVTLEQAAQHFVRSELDPVEHRQLKEEIAKLWKGDRARILRCDSCDFCHADPFVAGSGGFYALLNKNPSYARWRWEFGVTRDSVRELVSGIAQPRLLELGAGDGAFIRLVCPSFLPKDRAVCNEYSPAGAKAIRDYGITCEMTDVRSLKEAGYGDFTFVCLFQVLEHLDDLDALFVSLNDLTRQGAHAYISTPNNEYITLCEHNGGLLDMPPNHVGRWNAKAYESLGRRHGWSVVEHRVEPAGFRSIVKSVGGSRYMQRRLTPGSLANRASLFRNRTLRRIAGLPFLFADILAAIPTAWRHRGDPVGGAQWVHLKRD
jgi:SAM-dependent methyltransferase